jgi:uncharacterized caspase-like protein
MKSFPSCFKKLLAIAAALFVGIGLLLDAADPAEERGVGGIVPSGVGQYRSSWAVVIGINQYSKAPRLNYAVNDARSVVAAAQKLGFASDKILLLLDNEATKQRIEQLLYGTLRRTSPEDRVFVFFAGHGMTTSLPRGGEEGFILPVDGAPDDLPLTAIAMEDIRKIARRIPAKHILFTVDACYSGFAISRDITPSNVDSVYLAAVTREPAVQIITAGRKGEPVLEEEGHGLFTRRLLSGLTGLADTDQNGFITAQELATWLESRVVRDSQDKQHPQYSRLDGEGQFVFVMPDRQKPATPTIQDEREKLKEDLKRLAEEAERFKQERALFEEQRKVQEERQRVEMALLEAERSVLKTETERLSAERARSEEARREIEHKRQTEDVANAELAKLTADRARVKADEERIQKEMAQSEEARREGERKRLIEDAAKAELAKLEAETARLKSEEERIAREKSLVDELRLDTERRQKSQETATASQAEIIAKLTPPLPSARPPVPIPSVAQLPKYKIGDSWTVRFEDGRTTTRTVRAVNNGQYVFEWGFDLLRYYDENLVLRGQTTPEDGKDVFTDLLRKQIIDFPLSIDKSWEFEFQTYRGAGWRERRVFRFKVLGIETIQTAAGTFEAFKIQEMSHVTWCAGCRAYSGTLGIRYWWYAPEVKYPVRISTVVTPRSQIRAVAVAVETDQDYELEAFELK